MLGSTSIDSGCCSDARAFVVAGCACSADVVTLVDSLRILPAGTDTPMAISGVVSGRGGGDARAAAAEVSLF